MDKFKEEKEQRKGIRTFKELMENCNSVNRPVPTPLQLEYPDHDHQKCLEDSVQGGWTYNYYHYEPDEFEEMEEAWRDGTEP